MNKVPPPFEQTEAGLIPADWESPALDTVAKRGSGHTPDKKHPEYWNGNIKWVSLKDSDALDQVFIEETSASITPAGIANSSAVVHPAGTVVLSRDAGVGKSAILKTSMAVSQHFMAWQCSPKLENTFLYYWLQSKKPELERIAMGNTIKTIGLSYFKTLRIPSPPLAEQRAIAAALMDVDIFLAKLDALIAKKHDLKQAAMQQLLTSQTRLPGFSAEWQTRRLGAVLSVRHGKSQRGIDNPGGINSILATGGEIGRTNSFLYDKPSVLIGRKGTIDKPKYQNSPFWCVDTLFYTEIVSGVHPKFVYFKFLMLDWRSYNEASGVPSLSASTIESIEISVPNLNEQVAITEILSDMDAEITALEARRDKTCALKQGMMQELLTGRIRLI